MRAAHGRIARPKPTSQDRVSELYECRWVEIYQVLELAGGGKDCIQFLSVGDYQDPAHTIQPALRYHLAYFIIIN